MSMLQVRNQAAGFRIQGIVHRNPSAGAAIMVGAIRGYQRWISPYKGYVCAHRQWHGGPSCSEFARRHILENGVWRAIPGIRTRFGECGEAARRLWQWRREARLAAAGRHAEVLAMARGRSAKRSLEERMYEEEEKKRKRLNELQGDNPWCVGPEWWDWCAIPGPCAAMGCMGSFFGHLPGSPLD